MTAAPAPRRKKRKLTKEFRLHGRLALRTIRKLEKFVDRWWYTPLIALLAAADIFILVVPTDALLISAVMMRPKKWISRFIWVSFGSALGAWAMGLAIDALGTEPLHRFIGGAIGSDSWKNTAQYVHDHGALSVAFFSAGPFPLQPGVVLAALAGIPPLDLFLWAWVGRALKYGVFAWIASHAPKLLKKLKKQKGLDDEPEPAPRVSPRRRRQSEVDRGA